MKIIFNPIHCINCGITSFLKEDSNLEKHNEELKRYIRANSPSISAPNTTGVYIWGVKKLVSGKNVFCPLYVGIAEHSTIASRLLDHYKRTNWNKRELFNLLVSPSQFYQTISLYNIHKLNNSSKRTIVADLCRFFTSNPIVLTDLLIFHQNMNFWNFRYRVPTIYDVTQTDALRLALSSLDKTSIMSTRNYLAENFCYTYAKLPISFTGSIRGVEKTVKSTLENDFGIHTASQARGKIISDLEIDFSLAATGKCALDFWDIKA